MLLCGQVPRNEVPDSIEIHHKPQMNMKKQVVYAMLLGASVVGLSSCNDSALEERIGHLEQRVATLEGNGAQSRNSSTAVNPSPDQLASIEETKGPAAKFEFEQDEFDFGTVKEGEVVTHVFKFKNVGEAPLVIQNASATCGCTVPDYSRKPIPVGETGEVQVKFNSQGRVGTQSKNVTITANTKPATTTVKIRGVVEAKGDADLAAGPVRK